MLFVWNYRALGQLLFSLIVDFIFTQATSSGGIEGIHLITFPLLKSLDCFPVYLLCFLLRPQHVSGSCFVWSDPGMWCCGQDQLCIPDNSFSGLSNPLFYLSRMDLGQNMTCSMCWHWADTMQGINEAAAMIFIVGNGSCFVVCPCGFMNGKRGLEQRGSEIWSILVTSDETSLPLAPSHVRLQSFWSSHRLQ